MRWIIAAVAMALGAVIGAGGHWFYVQHQADKAAQERAAIDAERAHLAEKLARPFFEDTLIDPSSLQFREVRVHGLTVCGEYNARNRSGGYVGFRRFMLAPTGEATTIKTAEDYETEFPRRSYERDRMIRRLVELQDGHWFASCERPLEGPAELQASLDSFRAAVNSTQETPAEPN